MKPSSWIGLVAALFVVSASAQETIYGLMLGQPLRIAECRKSNIGGRLVYVAPAVEPCVQINFSVPAEDLDVRTASKDVSIHFPAGSAPTHSKYPQVSAMLRQGRLEAITVTTHGYSSQEVVYKDLVAKYGPPATLTRVPLQGFGPNLTNALVARWSRLDLVVEFLGVSGGPDGGLLRVMTQNGAAEITRALNQSYQGRTPL